MKITCGNNHHSPNNHISCCLTYLLTSKYQYDSTFQTLSYATFFLRTLSHCNKILPLSSLSIPYSSLISLLDVITHCSSLFYFIGHYHYSKFLVLTGLQISNSTSDKIKKEIKKRKVALFNIISCIYFTGKKYSKAIKYAKKSFEYSHSKIDKSIAHNNLAIIYFSIWSNQLTFNHNISFNSIIENITLSYGKIDKRFTNEYKHKSKKKKSKSESIALILLNYVNILERDTDKTSKCDINNLIQKGYDYSLKSIGDKSYITLLFYNKIQKGDNQKVLTRKKISENHINFDIPIITISSEKKMTQDVFYKNEEKDINDFNLRNSEIKPYLQTNNNAHEFFSKKSESTPSSYKNITNPKRIKDTQNYFFSLDKKQKQSKMSIMSLFVPQIGQGMISPTSINCPITPKANPFDNLMKRLNDNYKSSEEFNNNYKSVEPTPKIIINERKRNTLQFNINANQSLLEVKSSFCTQNVNRRATELFHDLIISYEEELSNYPQFIDLCLNYDQYDTTTNYYQTKSINDAYAAEYLGTLFTSKQKQDPNDTFCIKYNNNNEYYSIYIKNNFEKGSMKIEIIFDTIDKKIEEEYSYDDLIREINQIFFWNSMPIHCHINFITNTSMLIEQILIHHFQLLKSSSQIEFSQVGILSHPITFSFMLFEFEFFNTFCRFNIHIRKYYIILLIVSSLDESIYLRLNITMDSSSFNILFKQNTFTSHTHISDVILIPTYSPLSPDTARCLFIDFLIKLQEIIKHNFSIPPSSFNDLVELSQKSIYKIIFEDSLKKKELYILSYNSENIKWVIEYFSISIIEISDSSLYMHKILELTAFDFANIIGVDPFDVVNKMSNKNIIITHSILLNSVKLRNIMMKILTEENYDAMIRLVKIRPVTLFLFKSVIVHMKKYYCCSFEFLIFSNEMYFIRIIAMESSICRSYSKIFLPYFLECNSNHIDNIKSEFEEKYSFIKSIDKRKMSDMLKEEVLLLLVKTEKMHMYDNIIALLTKLNPENKFELKVMDGQAKFK